MEVERLFGSFLRWFRYRRFFFDCNVCGFIRERNFFSIF
jgi:hypothetical protein